MRIRSGACTSQSVGKICLTRTWRAACAATLAAIALAPPAYARTASAKSNATIVAPLSLVKTTDLEFGLIIPGTTAGTVTIDESNGARGRTGGVTLAGTGFGRATFLGNTGTRALVLFQLSTDTVTLSRSGGGSMNASLELETLPGTFLFNSSTTKLVVMNDNQVFAIHVGGTLTVGANQPKGFYDATFTLTANYY
jgi:Domain of unknown function (DUF4402)